MVLSTKWIAFTNFNETIYKNGGGEEKKVYAMEYNISQPKQIFCMNIDR